MRGGVGDLADGVWRMGIHQGRWRRAVINRAVLVFFSEFRLQSPASIKMNQGPVRRWLHLQGCEQRLGRQGHLLRAVASRA